MLPIIFVAISFVVSFLLAPLMPAQMANHWGISGAADGYSSANFGLYFLPTLSLVLLGIFKILPKADPYKKNFSQFESYYNQFVIVITLFFVYIHALTLIWNLGYEFNMVQLMSPAMGILFYFAGVLSQNTKPNWFVGIRTPWTMSNKVVWKKTHQLGGKLFQVTGLLAAIGFFFPSFAFYLLFIPIISTTVIVFVYSYLLYQKLNAK